MGTNFYLYRTPVCEHCGQETSPPLHIGKSSSGWCFSLHVIPEERLSSLADWEKEWSRPGVAIRNEYDDTVTPAEILRIITDRKGPASSQQHEEEFLAQNHAVDGPQGLLRHEMDGRHCVANGPGTWDLIAGEFC